MALLSAQAPGITGAALTYSAVNSSDTFVPGANVYLHVKTVGTGCNVTVVVPGSLYGQARADVVTAVGTNTDRIFGPFVADLADPSTGVVTVSFSATSSITSALLQMG